MDKYFEIFQYIVSNYDERNHNRHNFALFMSKVKQVVLRFKQTIRRSTQVYSSPECTPNLQKDSTKHIIGSNEKLIVLIKKFRKYQQFVNIGEEQYGPIENH